MSTATLTAVTLTAAPLRTPPARVRTTGSALVLTERGRRSVRALLWLVVTSVTAAVLVLLWLALAATVAPGAVAGDGGGGVSSGVVVGSPVGGAVTGEAVLAEVVVRPGDTLWGIAGTHAPDRDPRSVVADIVAVNELSSTGVQVGARLLVPTG